MREKIWTPEELEWLKENYPIKSDYDCRTYLHVSRYRLIHKVMEMGLKKRRMTTQYTLVPTKKRLCVWLDEGSSGFCRDCSKYVMGGICEKNGKEIGALWQKKCFKGEA